MGTQAWESYKWIYVYAKWQPLGSQSRIFGRFTLPVHIALVVDTNERGSESASYSLTYSGV